MYLPPPPPPPPFGSYEPYFGRKSDIAPIILLEALKAADPAEWDICGLARSGLSRVLGGSQVGPDMPEASVKQYVTF